MPSQEKELVEVEVQDQPNALLRLSRTTTTERRARVAKLHDDTLVVISNKRFKVVDLMSVLNNHRGAVKAIFGPRCSLTHIDVLGISF